MSSKKARRELLRVLVLAALLSTPYMGAAAVEYPITGDTIGGTHDLQGKYSLFDFASDQNVTATGNVKVTSKWPGGEVSVGEGIIFDGGFKEDSANENLDLNMDGYSLSIDAEPDILYIERDNVSVNIHDADKIEMTAHYGAIMGVWGMSGNSINLQAKNDILLAQADSDSWSSYISVDGDNQLKLTAGNDIVLQSNVSGPMMSIGENSKAEMNAGNNITFDKSGISSWDGGFLKIDAGKDITFNEADIEVWRNGELQMTAGNDIKVNGEGVAGIDLNGEGILHMEAGQITFDKADIEAIEEATLEMNSDKDITFDNGNIDIQSGAKINMDAGNNLKLDNTNVNVQDEAALKMDADKDITFDKTNVVVQGSANLNIDNVNNIVFNKTNDESDSPSLYIDDNGEVTLQAKNDILFNRDQDGTFIGFGSRGTAEVTAEDGNIIFHENQVSNSPAIKVIFGSNLHMKAQTIKGNMQRLVEAAGNGEPEFSLTAKDIEWVAQGKEVDPVGLFDDASMVIASDGNFVFDADRTLKLSSEISPTLVHAFNSDVTLSAGDSIYLHNAGSDYRYWSQANLWAESGNIDLTTDGLISIDNKGAVAAQAVGFSKINFNGNTIMPEVGIGARSEDGGKINFNKNTVMSNVGIGAWAQTDFPYEGEETSEMDFNGLQTIDQAENRPVANFNNNNIVMRQADIDDWEETDDESEYEEDHRSKITFNGPLTILQAKNGAVARLDSDIVFNDALKIQAEDNAFYTKWAGRIQSLTEGVDKVIIGNMRAHNGQIDVLFDTADSSFTGFTELREIKKHYFYGEEDSEGDEGTCPAISGPGDCGDVEYPDEEIVDESTCPLEPGPGDCGDEDNGGCEEPVVDEGSHINITLRNGAFWDVTGDSTLTTLDNDSFVNMTDGTRSGTSITAKNLSGTGTIAMDLDWTSNGGAKEKTEHSDYIVATESATGTQTVVSDPATMHLDSMGIDDRLYFATLTNSDAVFTSPITQQNVTKGSLYDYTIGITSETTVTTDSAENIADRAATDTTTDWFFGTIGYTESPLVETGRINSNIMYDLVTDVDTLNKRMGDVRQMNTDPDGWWARTTYTHQDRDSYSGHSNRFELGKDFVTARNDGSVVHQGAVFTYLRSSDSFDNGNGKYKRYSGSLYHTWLGNNGQYVDVVGRIGKVMGNSHTFLINGTQSDSSFGTWYQQASVETGKTYDLEDGWYFEPQAQLQYTHMNSKSYTSSDGINHDLDSVNSFIGRLGFRLGQKMNDKTSWYVKGDILHEFSGDGGIMLTSANGLERIDYNRDGKDTWYDLGAGLTAELSPASSVWFEFERKFSGSYSNNWEFNGGISWKF
ncbi:autotransporter outer membrane beta-barrel domain-containing protein [Megasphaera massiliensis]|uniref:autotransporter outer membrane beta-barrel domain-containing protein n=2 Tax=Megasphaera massiliensis TaxID=1232428 RepID=UPI00210DE5F3|nr:autotransporter outer membrane beta-barrel domain-containing protein [Megasphaera massiliensis]MCQ5210487.1 autotransporter outer membrane beta-barrel domain-containing protein [Megasphaera massiliensis]